MSFRTTALAAAAVLCLGSITPASAQPQAPIRPRYTQFQSMFGGGRPLVMMQCTGFFESGDSLRNILHDWQLPIPSIIGYRSYLSQATLPGDTCLTFTEPVLRAWQLDYRLVTEPGHFSVMSDHLRASIAGARPGVVLVAEGKA